MSEAKKKTTALFDNVGECPYRYRPSGVYQARIKAGGKEIRRSLQTKDKHVAKSNLSELRTKIGLATTFRMFTW